MISILFICLLLSLSFKTSTAIGVSDSSYHQDISHRSVFKNSNQVAGWEPLPFNNLDGPVVHVAASDCFVGLSSGALYSASRNLTRNKIALESPYHQWVLLDGTAPSDTTFLVPSSSSGISFFALTDNNIFAVRLTPSSCGVLESFSPISNSDFKCGKTLAATSSKTHVWVSSSDAGFLSVNIKTGALTKVLIDGMGANEIVSSLFYVSKWNKLFAGTSSALYSAFFDGVNFSRTQHEWIGGIIDSTVLIMSYDTVNDALWVAEKNSVHKLTSEQIWYRYGQRQGSPSANVTSVAAVNGFIYVGSDYGVFRVRGDLNPTQIYKSSSYSTSPVNDPPGDPWQWLYFSGPRYLTDNAVKYLVAGPQVDSDCFVLITGSSGITLLESSLWRLAEKSESLETFQYPRHNREGLTSGVGLKVYADVSSYIQQCEDNDGLWTSMHAMGETYRFLNTGAEDARESVWEAFEALEMLSILPGDYPHFPARSFVKDSDSGLPGCSGEPWQSSKVLAGYSWKATTSSDEIDGHLAVYPLIYDHIARTESEKKRVYTLIEGITGGILANGLYLIDPSTGEPTLWGFWAPEEVNNNPERYSERGTNSIGILAYCASAYSVTHDEKYKNTFWELAMKYGYLYNSVNGKVDNPVEDNHSDNELIFMTYHILLYALQRLDENDSALTEIRASVQEMVDAMLPSLHRTWSIVQGERSPLWLGVYAGTGGQTVDSSAIDNAVWSLRHSAIDLIDWTISNTDRWDITPSPFFRRDSTEPLMRQILPPQERSATKWNSDPFEFSSGGGGYSEEAPYIWQLPYHLMLYNGLILKAE